MNTIDLTPIIEAIIALLAAILTYKVIPWIKARTTAQQQETMRATVKTLVYAAEQLYGSKTGKEKLAYVQIGLHKRGYDIDLDEIEAAVKEMGLYTIVYDANTDEPEPEHPPEEAENACEDETQSNE